MNYGNVQIFSSDKPIFKCKTLFLDKCDKNFVCFWLEKNIFPNTENIYIGSHPCEPYTLNRDDMGNMFLHNNYQRFKHMWWPNCDNVKMISDQDYQKLLDSYEDDEIKLE